MNGKYWDKALSLVEGCTPVSAACDHCWLADISRRFQKGINLGGKDKAVKIFTSFETGKFNGTVRTRPDRLDIPLKRKKPTVYAVWSDLFHPEIPDEFIEKALNVVYDAKQHTFLILTKRPERMRDFLLGTSGAGANFEFDNLWLGVTAENQEQADKRIPILLQIPSAKRFVSIEPMLGPVDLDKIPPGNSGRWCGFGPSEFKCDTYKAKDGLDLVVLGGESGHGARPMHPDWARGVRDQCQAAGVPFFFKQWGEWRKQEPYGHETDGDATMFRCGLRKAGRLLDGQEHNELPWREIAEREEWHRKYKARMIEVAKITEDDAQASLEAGMDTYNYDDDPADSADEEMSYWSD
jgi:protein gp37